MFCKPDKNETNESCCNSVTGSPPAVSLTQPLSSVNSLLQFDNQQSCDNISAGGNTMAFHYENDAREQDPHALPTIEVFQLTALEAAELHDDDIRQYLKRPEFRLATMNGRDRERMLDAMIEELGIEGGYFYHFCFPGCLPEGEPIGPFKTYDEALQAAKDDANE